MTIQESDGEDTATMKIVMEKSQSQLLLVLNMMPAWSTLSTMWPVMPLISTQENWMLRLFHSETTISHGSSGMHQKSQHFQKPIRLWVSSKVLAFQKQLSQPSLLPFSGTNQSILIFTSIAKMLVVPLTKSSMETHQKQDAQVLLIQTCKPLNTTKIEVVSH